MKVFMSRNEDGSLLVTARAESGDVLGDMFRDLYPGDKFLGWTFDELAMLGSGAHDLDPKKDESDGK